MSGSVIIKPIQANFDHETSKITHIHPIFVVTIGSQTVEGGPSKTEGVHTRWEDSVTVQRGEESSCLIQLKDKDSVATDNVIGFIRDGLEGARYSRQILKDFQAYAQGRAYRRDFG